MVHNRHGCELSECYGSRHGTNETDDVWPQFQLRDSKYVNIQNSKIRLNTLKQCNDKLVDINEVVIASILRKENDTTL